MFINNQISTHKLVLSILFLFASVSLGIRSGIAQTDGAVLQNGLDKNEPAFIDASFRPSLGNAAATVNKTIIQPDGKILVAGNFHVINSEIKTGVARFNADGTLDTSFNTKTGANGNVMAIGLLNDGKIIIGGSFTVYGGQTVGISPGSTRTEVLT